MSQFLEKLTALQKNLNDFERQARGGERPTEEFVSKILQETCTVVREAEDTHTHKLDRIIKRADRLINQSLKFRANKHTSYPGPPLSFAHVAQISPLIKGERVVYDDPTGKTRMCSGKYDAPRFNERCVNCSNALDPTSRPHPNTTLLARFREDVPPLSITSAQSSANVIYQARAEVYSERTCLPIQLNMSSDGSCMSFIGLGGWKDRSPVLSYYNLENEEDGLPEGYHREVGLSSDMNQSAIDDLLGLLFVADSNRIKSFSWHPLGREGGHKYPLSTHTMKSSRFNGALAVLSPGQVIRAGEGRAALWDMESLETHDLDGNSYVGGRVRCKESFLGYNSGEIELSKGSSPTSTMSFEDPNLSPAVWHAVSGNLGIMLCSTGPGCYHYSCFLQDLHHGGKFAGRFLGHGGIVKQYSTSDVDPSVFTTTCDDNICRIYDMRHPLPVLSVGAEAYSSALLVHPDGIPTLFTGCERNEQIKVWDIRARASVYELATGNNAVVSMAWDSHRDSLYVATACRYMDEAGRNFDYRPARIPCVLGVEGPEPSTGEENHYVGSDVNGANETKDVDNYSGMCWPVKAYHSENYFGHIFDAGEHRIYRFAFKDDADATVVPKYGQASLYYSD